MIHCEKEKCWVEGDHKRLLSEMVVAMESVRKCVVDARGPIYADTIMQALLDKVLSGEFRDQTQLVKDLRVKINVKGIAEQMDELRRQAAGGESL